MRKIASSDIEDGTGGAEREETVGYCLNCTTFTQDQIIGSVLTQNSSVITLFANQQSVGNHTRTLCDQNIESETDVTRQLRNDSDCCSKRRIQVQ